MADDCKPRLDRASGGPTRFLAAVTCGTAMIREQLERDNDLAAWRRERDHHREPGRRRQRPPSLVRRWAFQARVIEMVNAAADAGAMPSDLISLPCPTCHGLVCARSAERSELECPACGAELVIAAEDNELRLRELA